MIPVEKRKELKAMIPHGGMKKIAKTIGISEVSVSAWVNGKSNSLRVEIAVIKAAAKTRREIKEFLKELGL